MTKVTTPTNHKRGPKPDPDLLDKAKLVNLRRTSKITQGLFHAPQEPEEIALLAQDLEEWASNEDSIVLEDFILSKRLKPTSFYTCARNNRVLELALADAKYAISARIQNKLAHNPIYLQKYLPYFHAGMNQWELDKAKAIKQEEKQEKVQYVIIEKGDS